MQREISEIVVVFLLACCYVFVAMRIRRSVLSRKGVSIFLVGATALALFRASSIWYWFYVMHASGGRTAMRLILLPEGMTLLFLNEYSNWLFGAPIITDPDRTMVVATVLAFVGSYILASPLMLVGSKRK